METMQRVLDELLPIGSKIKLHDPLLMTCAIDGQPSLRCDAPNHELILSDRIKDCFVLAKLDDLRDRGNQAYVRGDIQLALDYYTYAVSRILTMAGMSLSKDNNQEFSLLQNAFRHDLVRLHSNRAACYLREHLYEASNMDTLVVVAGHLFNTTDDELFLKCLHRLICATIGLGNITSSINELLNLGQNVAINVNLRWKYSAHFSQIYLNLPRLKNEHEHGIYNLKDMFKQPSFHDQALFDIHTFHPSFHHTSLIKERCHQYYAKRSIPAGTLLLAENAFACVQSGDHDQRRLLNEIEKHLVLASSVNEFEAMRKMPFINRWFDEKTDADEDDYDTYPKSIPWGLLAKAQEHNHYRSKSFVGWWPDATLFGAAVHTKGKANCLWFVCGKMIFVFSFVSIDKNDALVVARPQSISSFLQDHRSDFSFSLGDKNQVRLDEIFAELTQTQIYFRS